MKDVTHDVQEFGFNVHVTHGDEQVVQTLPTFEGTRGDGHTVTHLPELKKYPDKHFVQLFKSWLQV